jgi:hypothetical protein
MSLDNTNKTDAIIKQESEIYPQVVDIPVKKKKGRPRKDATPLSQPEIDVPEVEKKKRGRKKKEVVIVEEKKKKKRGRKAQVKYFSSSIRKKIPLTSFLQDNDSAILHIDINDNNNELDQPTVGNLSFDPIPSNPTQQVFDTEYKKQNTENNGVNIIEAVFEKLKLDDSPQLESVRNDLGQLLENDNSILSDFLDSQNESDLRGLYEKRINFREEQDKNLVDKLEVLHKDEALFSQIVGKKPKPSSKDIEKEREEGQEFNRRKGYFEILYNFVHNKQWLEHTDVCCWWCCHKFDSLPIGMPTDFNSKQKKFLVKGVFCSFACMTSYRDTKHNNVNTNSLVSYLYSKLTAEPIGTKICRAPPKESLKMFGGELSIEEFRSSTSESKIYKMMEYPMIVSRDYIEEIDIANVKNANVKVFEESSFTRVVNLDDKRVNDARTRLSSQIEKSTVTRGNTIDKFIKVS